MTGEIIEGDAVEALEHLNEDEVHTCITSPPYYGLREYTGDDREIGLEEHLNDYISNIVEVGNELQRVLRDDGSWWLNLGDSYAGGGGVAGKPEDHDDMHDDDNYPESVPLRNSSFPDKCKMMVPHRVAIALVDSGWILRNDCVWYKDGSEMPESCSDRLSQTFEYVFHLTQQQDYYYDLDAIREPYKDKSISRQQYGHSGKEMKGRYEAPNEDREGVSAGENYLTQGGANPGDLFAITTAQYPESHYAVFPDELVETPLKATCPPMTCKECGAPYEREIQKVGREEPPEDGIVIKPEKGKHKGRPENSPGNRAHYWSEQRKANVNQTEFARWLKPQTKDSEVREKLDEAFGRTQWEHYVRTDDSGACLPTPEDAETLHEIIGLEDYYEPLTETHYLPVDDSMSCHTSEFVKKCDCDTDETEPGTVIDPFAGRGTTGKVARELGRDYILIDLDADSIELAKQYTKHEENNILENGW